MKTEKTKIELLRGQIKLKMKNRFLIFSSTLLLLLILSSFLKKPVDTITIFMIGDSTMDNKPPERYPLTGWGQVFGEFFNDQIIVENHAKGGRSSKSFITEGRWSTVMEKLKPGDYVFIQFGHNDQKPDFPELYTNPYSTYRANIEKYVNETRSKGAIPIILSSIIRQRFNEQGSLIDTHGAYPFVSWSVANELDVCFIDLQVMTETLVNQLGPKESEKIYLFLKPGESDNYPDGISDRTHLCRYGAKQVAALVADDLKRQNHALAKYLKLK